MSELTDKELPGYCRTHCRTDRSLFNGKHLNRLIELAGNPVNYSKVPDCWYTVREEYIDPLAELAEANMKAVEESKQWAESLQPEATQPTPHPDDLAVDSFAIAMKAKMSASRDKGRGGWDDEARCPTKLLQSMLAEHVAKGDPVDVGNFCMMLFNRQAPTVKAVQVVQTDEVAVWLRAMKSAKDVFDSEVMALQTIDYIEAFVNSYLTVQAKLSPSQDVPREDVQKWRDDIAHAAAGIVSRAIPSFGDGDWSWLVEAIHGLASKPAPAVAAIPALGPVYKEVKFFVHHCSSLSNGKYFKSLVLARFNSDEEAVEYARWYEEVDNPLRVTVANSMQAQTMRDLVHGTKVYPTTQY